MRRYLFLFRPWYGLVITFVLISGMWYARPGFSLEPLPLTMIILGFYLIYISVLPINDFFDRESDAINHPERPLVRMQKLLPAFAGVFSRETGNLFLHVPLATGALSVQQTILSTRIWTT